MGNTLTNLKSKAKKEAEIKSYCKVVERPTLIAIGIKIFKKLKKIILACWVLNMIENVSSSTSHKKNSIFQSFRLSLREFKKILPNTFIYKLILIKIYMNTNIINTQIFH